MSENSKQIKSNLWDIVRRILTIFLILFSILILLCTCLISVLNNDDNDFIFGYKPYINDGNIILVSKVNEEDIKIGDPIAYRSIEPNHYNEICFDVIEEDTVYEEETAYITLNMDDEGMYYPAKVSNIIGVSNVVIPGAGNLFNFLLKPLGYILLVLVPFLLGVGIRVIDIIKR